MNDVKMSSYTIDSLLINRFIINLNNKSISLCIHINCKMYSMPNITCSKTKPLYLSMYVNPIELVLDELNGCIRRLQKPANLLDIELSFV